MGYPVRDFHSFAETVERNFHDRKTNWTIVFLANACSDSRASRYIIENFSIMDELSNEINFYLPGYSTSNLRNNNHRNEDDDQFREEEKYHELYWKMQNASFEEFQRMLRGFESRTIIHKNELQDIRNTLDEMNCLSYDNERMDYKGEGISVIRSKRLGNILFNDAEFSSFVLEFSSLNKEYIYQGGCDMILIRTLNGKLSYENAVIYNLDAIIDCPHGPSLDSFLYHVFNVFRGEHFSQNTRNVSLYDLLNDIRRRDGRDNKIIDQIEQDIRHMNNPLYTMFHRSSMPTEEDILFRIDKYLLMSQIDELYHEATYYGRTREEPYQIIIRREIEHHLRWNLDEEFYFISYSNQDTSKAMMVKTLLERRNKHVWIAPNGIPQGRDYSSVISNTLYKCRNFVLLLTRNSAQSKWVMRELDIAVSRDFDTKIKIIFTDDFSVNDIQEYPELYFYINKVQGKFTFEDIYNNEDSLTNFIEE